MTLRLVYTPSAQQVCHTLRSCCSCAVAVHTMPDNVYAFLRPIATFHLSAFEIYRMPHSPHICVALQFCHIMQYSLRFGYLAWRCICLAIIVFYVASNVFYRSEIYSSICTLSSTMPSVLHILRWSSSALRCIFLLICMRIVTMLALQHVDITRSQVKRTMPSVLHVLPWSFIALRCFFLLFRIRIVTMLTLLPLDVIGSQV